MARENIYIINDMPAWPQSAGAVNTFIWCVRNGATIAGSETVPSGVAFTPTGNNFVDVAQFISDYMLAATGDAPAGTPIIDPPAVFINGWGVTGLEGEGPGGQQPGVYLWAGEGYDFGTLNLPLQTGATDYRDWFIKFTAEVTAAEAVPAWPLITDYILNEGSNPVLHVAELKSIE